jgi:hypothetical protein
MDFQSNNHRCGPPAEYCFSGLDSSRITKRDWRPMGSAIERCVGVRCVPAHRIWASGRFQIGAAALVIALLFVIPANAGTVPTSLEEWIGATLGFLVGTSLGGGTYSALKRWETSGSARQLCDSRGESWGG